MNIDNTTSGRIDILDILRGLAIFGIFIANSSNFSLYLFQEDHVKQSFCTFQVDQWLDFLMKAFVEGKFYSLFSLLFGIGFTIILDRTRAKGKNPLLIFYRRLLVLALFGVGHLFLLWEGDILLLYALVGMILPLFNNLSNRNLIIISVCLIFSPILIDMLKVLSNNEWNLAKPLEKMAIAVDKESGITEENFRTYLVDHNTYASIYNWCRGAFFWRYEYIISSNRIPKVLAMFLLGIVAGRGLRAKPLSDYEYLLRKVKVYGFILGIPFSLAFAYFMGDKWNLPDPMGLFDTFFYAISVIPLSLAMTSTVCLYSLNGRCKRYLSLVAPVGRMALTNYIMQTIIGILIYYGFGLSLGARTGPAVFIPIATAVFGFQIIFSILWLKLFYFGPLEWIWRMLTYGKFVKLIK
jgi:uncharacterized protein